MTNQGQCRLAPLIACIQDSSHLYDFSVKVLFRLHSVLPSSTLDGHRQRFFQQYKSLKLFYDNSSNLQYFRNLIQVPTLPDTLPNFLRASDLESHVTPVVIVPKDRDAVLVDLNFVRFFFN
jgi:huntingtin interacting protein 1